MVTIHKVGAGPKTRCGLDVRDLFEEGWASSWETVNCAYCHATGGLMPISQAHEEIGFRSFTWPCDKRTAHEPHTIPKETFPCRCSQSYPGFDKAPFINTSQCPVHKSGAGDVDCEGVKAHPATQIGGNYREGEY